MTSLNVLRAGSVNQATKPRQSPTGIMGLAAPQKSVPFQNPFERATESLVCIHVAVVATKEVQASHIGSSFWLSSFNKGLVSIIALVAVALHFLIPWQTIP